MPSIKFHCSECDANLKLPATAAGKRVKCPQCGTAVRVPIPNGSAEEQPARKRRPTKKVKRRGPKSSSLLPVVVGVIVVAVVLVVAVVFVLQRMRGNTDLPKAEAQVDQEAPAPKPAEAPAAPKPAEAKQASAKLPSVPQFPNRPGITAKGKLTVDRDSIELGFAYAKRQPGGGYQLLILSKSINPGKLQKDWRQIDELRDGFNQGLLIDLDEKGHVDLMNVCHRQLAATNGRLSIRGSSPLASFETDGNRIGGKDQRRGGDNPSWSYSLTFTVTVMQ